MTDMSSHVQAANALQVNIDPLITDRQAAIDFKVAQIANMRIQEFAKGDFCNNCRSWQLQEQKLKRRGKMQHGNDDNEKAVILDQVRGPVPGTCRWCPTTSGWTDRWVGRPRYFCVITIKGEKGSVFRCGRDLANHTNS